LDETFTGGKARNNALREAEAPWHHPGSLDGQKVAVLGRRFGAAESRNDENH
jgi:hypothetical protein